jgi:hypothetical protein
VKTSIVSSVTVRLWIQQAVVYAAALSVFTLILVNRSPNFLRPFSMNVQFGFTWIVPLLFILLYIAFRLPDWYGKLLSVTLALSVFALALAGIWASGHTQSTILSGLIPFYDAQAYYVDALRLLAGKDVSDFSSARPLFAGWLAGLLALTGRNLTLVVGSLAAINGVACYLAAMEIRRTHGVSPAVFLLIFLFLYYRHRTAGTVMSENLGFPLGILGFVLIWQGIAHASHRPVLFGLFLTTLGLNARPGPLFILPFQLIWAGWYFRESGKQFSWRIFLLGTFAIASGFALNLLMVRLLGTPSGVPFAQFSYALYGLASGGKSWHYVFDTHPELFNLLEPQRTQLIYKLTFDLILDNPARLLQGAIYNWSMLFSTSGYGVFSYIGGENNLINTWARWGCYVLCILGIIKWTRAPSDPYTSLITVSSLGILASVPFVPPADAYGMRLYAAGITILGLLPAMGLVFALNKSGFNDLQNSTKVTTDSHTTTWYATSLILLTFIGPIFVKGTDSVSSVPEIGCQSEIDSILFRFDPGSSIHLIKEKDFRLDWMPVFHQGLFKRNAHSLPDNYLAEWLEDIGAPTTLFYSLDYRSNRAVFVIVPTSLLPEDGTVVEMCGNWESDSSLTAYSIFMAEAVLDIAN